MDTLSPRIEHTLLRPDASAADHERLCAEAVAHGFAGVCVLPTRIPLCRARLAQSACRVVTVVGFPLGAALEDGKAREARAAIAAGADEVDMVWSLGDVRDGRWDRVREEIVAVREACQGRPLKVIVETSVLSDADKRLAAELVADAGAAYIKTSTGFSSGGATVADVQLFRATVGTRLRVKASGGIRTRAAALALVAAGADRIGTSCGPDLLG